MKNLIMEFLLITIVLISLCTEIPNFPEIPFLNTSIQPTSGFGISNEDIYINVNALPSEVTGGNNVTFIFRITNKASYDLEDVYLNIYDPCVFNSGSWYEWRPKDGILKSNHTVSNSTTLTSDIITLSRDCKVKFAVSYKGKFSFYQDVVVLSQSEYNTRLIQGTLKNIPIKSSSSSSPLKISTTFLEEQPLLEGTSVNVQINYAYSGDGFINVSKGDVKITIPSNLKSSNDPCIGDYELSGSQLLLKENLKFINKRVSPSICTFTTTASQPIDIKTLSISANYIYTIDSSIPVRVKGTSKT